MVMRTWLALSFAPLLAGPNSATARADAATAAPYHWLMMVTTENTDPAREVEFNDWYDKIDLPDVLEVPGYERARRGVEQRGYEDTTRTGQAAPVDVPLKYLALYDIASRDIDKTIIDMLMASWGMEKNHRSTDLLKVTERVYFHQHGPIYRAAKSVTPRIHRYLYTVRYDCCRSAASARAFDRWYATRYVPALLRSGSVSSVARFKLYRVLMDRPVVIPAFMSVIEIDADSLAQALAVLRTAPDFAGHGIHAGSGSLFLQIKDASRP
jgi:hypothetical protein